MQERLAPQRKLALLGDQITELAAHLDAGEFGFSLPRGEAIPQTTHGRSRGNVLTILVGNRRNGLKITPNTPVPRGYGEKMDNSLAVLALIQRE